MGEKRQIQFEHYTNLPLGGNWAGEWPAYVLVHHEGAVDDVRYVPERTCRAVMPPSEPGVEEIHVCSGCGRQLLLEDDDEYCPRCGARIEDEVGE